MPLFSSSSSDGAPACFSSASPPPARWVEAPFDPLLADRLSREAEVSPLVGRILAARGFRDGDHVRGFMSPTLASTHDPFLMADMDRAVDRIAREIAERRPIWVYGDYDVDGVTATAILSATLEHLGADARTYIPHRINEGYGLRREAVEQLAAEGARLIVTVDNGVTAIDEVARAAELGVDVVVTDHHEPGPELPAAAAVVNPKRADCRYPFKELCGAGVAFKLAHALLKRLAPDAAAAREFLKAQLDFAALGTVADIVPLIDENRAIVAHGLELLRRGDRPGVRSLFEVAGADPERTRADQLAFTLAPRINAAGRTEHADYALELLTTRDPKRARELAAMLERFNEDRRRIESDMTDEAFELLAERPDAPVVVVECEGWHPGVVGIVASRVLDRFHRPTVVIGIDGEWAKGSARSVPGFDMHEALTACAEHLDQYGGHAMAAGLRLRASKIDDFRRAVCEHARRRLGRAPIAPTLTIDARADAEELDDACAESIERMEPFGQGNRKPIVAIDGYNLIEEPRVLKGRHLKLRLAGPDGSDIWAIGFSMAGRAAELATRAGRLRLAATPFVNRWNGQARLELSLKDFALEP